jgi:replicative DNA helicase
MPTVVHSIYDLQHRYSTFATATSDVALDLGLWLPKMREHVRPLVPGELMTIMADTGVGKSAMLQNIAMSARDLDILFFEMELPGTMVFERFASMSSSLAQSTVEETYRAGCKIALLGLDHIYTCDKSRLKVEDMEGIIMGAARDKIGTLPQVVMVDYIGLMDSKGSNKRYERISDSAEGLKVLAKNTNTIVACATQIHRKPESEGQDELYLHDAKDSSSIEASAGLLLGAWRDPEDSEILLVKILKNTKGRAGEIFKCQFNGATMTITEWKEKIETPEDWTQ